ncbi:MAG TPA: hypothetical protein VFY90_15090 [Tepidiformaceae bacterium]|nr:hypothetical protein [Tepidiformaceae bacterium]
MSRRPLVFVLAALAAVAVIVPVARASFSKNSPTAAPSSIQALAALGSGFTYQGRLTDGGGPANGIYDLRFILYDADAGGTQVGATVEKANIQIQNGLFTTELDFGASAFDGNARWLEIAIRPGDSAGAYTVLSPRQPINPVPYATYAKTAGTAALALPFTQSATSAVDTSLFNITQSGAGAAITGAATGGTGGKFSGATALEVAGPIKVSGANPAAFVHEATADAIDAACAAGQCTQIDNPLTNGDPNAILLVTQLWDADPGGQVYNPHAVGVWYDPEKEKWEIFNEDQEAMPEGALFNVLVIKR